MRTIPRTVITLLLATAGAAFAQADTPAARYQQQRADCLAGRTSQDRATCLKEAGAALAEARRGTLASGDASDWSRNAVARCASLPADDRDACERMMRGEGTADGSVEQGAILREMITRRVGSEPAAPVASPQ